MCVRADHSGQNCILKEADFLRPEIIQVFPDVITTAVTCDFSSTNSSINYAQKKIFVVICCLMV